MRPDLERIVESYDPPGDWLRRIDERRRKRLRNRRLGAGALGLSIGVVIILAAVRVGGLQPNNVEPRDPPRVPGSWTVLYREDFAGMETADGVLRWPTMDMPSLTAGARDNRYEVIIHRPFDWRYWAVAGADALDDVRVRAAITTPPTTPEVGPGLQGVVCATSDDPVRGYALAIDPSDGSWVIQRLTGSGAPEPLGRGVLGRIDDEIRTVVARCTLVDGAAQLSVRIDALVGRAVDPDPLGGFRGAGMYLASRGGAVGASFDNLVLEVPRT